MPDGPGRASGPQKQPRRDPTPGAPDTRTDEDRLRQTYDALRARMTEEAERVAMRLAEMPPGLALRSPPIVEELAALGDVERRLTLLRVELDQWGCAL